SRVAGIGPLVTRLGKLTGFDQEAFDRATAATERARVVCWRRGGAAAPAADAAAAVPASAAGQPQAPAAAAPAKASANSLELEVVPMVGEAAEQAAAPVAAVEPAPAPKRASAGGSLRMDIAPARTTVAGYADDTVRNMARVYKVKLDWTVESLV